jgi:hypothetical protein
MPQHRTFMDLTLDDDGLHTPDGLMALGSITRAEAVRHRSRPAASGDRAYDGYSPAGAAGGAVIGGALGGPVGFVAGALIGSRLSSDDDPGDRGVPRTVSASLIFESPESAYSTIVSKDRVEEAEAFVSAVKAAAGLE